jgi:thiol:disulfide interchange protein
LIVRHRFASVAALVILLVGAGAAWAQQPIHWSIAPPPPTTWGSTNRPLHVAVTAEIDPGWHLYAMTEPPGGPQALDFSLPEGNALSLAGPIVESTPSHAFDTNFNIETQFHEQGAAFTVPLRVNAGVKPGRYLVRLDVSYQTCNDRFCLPPNMEELRVEVAVGGPAASPHVSLGATEAARTPTTGPTAKPIPDREPDVPHLARTEPAPAVTRVADLASANAASTFSAYVSVAALMGGLSLLTPCVFPMVPITVSYFTRRAGRSRRDVVKQALVYGLGIVLTFTAVGFALAVAFGASGLNRFAADPWLNLGVTALFVAFALSLFGVYEPALPSRFLTMAAQADAGRGRHAGALLMGLAFTLTSFTCTAPFLGTLLVVASQGQWAWPLAGMLAFSTVFALPFVVLALAPQLLSSLPRSGSWMVVVKATMGLLELAAAMKFLSNVDLVWGWGVVTRPVVLGTWMALALVFVMYLAGVLRLGHAPRLPRPGLARFLAIASALALGIWLATGLSGRRLGELEAFLPPADLLGAGQQAELSWVVNDYDVALAEARRQHARVLVDFTGYTCTNCRWMEANMFPRLEVARELSRFVRLRLYTDGRGEMFRRFQQMEQHLFGTVALPYYAVFTPDGRPIVAFGGLTRSPAEYITFLRKGLE